MSNGILETSKKLDQLANDYKAVCICLRTAEDEAREILAAVGARIDSEKAYNSKRVKELEATVKDGARSATIQRMAQLELEQLRAAAPTITQQERQAYEAKCTEACQALADLRKTKAQLLAVHEQAKRQLEEMRPCSIYPVDLQTFESQVGGMTEAFEARYGKKAM